MKRIKVRTKEELKELIVKTIEEKGLKCDLNFIDTSGITDMSNLFSFSNFNGDISKWDVSNVTDMAGLFGYSNFNGDISRWDVSHVTGMSHMFQFSKFNQSIRNWDTSNVRNMLGMFGTSRFNKDISRWDVSQVIEMSNMFENSIFNQDISKWNVKNVSQFSGFGLQKEEFLPLKFKNPLEQSKSYIGWKTLSSGYLCKLLIPEDSIKFGLYNGSCRTNRAKVIEIVDSCGNKIETGKSIHFHSFIYATGKEATADNFNSDRWDLCGGGIYFYRTEKEALDYYHNFTDLNEMCRIIYRNG